MLSWISLSFLKKQLKFKSEIVSVVKWRVSWALKTFLKKEFVKLSPQEKENSNLLNIY